MQRLSESSCVRMVFSGVLCCALFVSIGATSAKPGQTGQGIMIDLMTDGEMGITSTEVYLYDRDTAATYFTNAWDGNPPTVSCAGLPSACANPAPPAPAAPDPLDFQVRSILPSSATSTNKCTFFAGGTLAGKSYANIDTINEGSGLSFRTYIYNYSYVITPIVNPVDTLTAWNLIFETNPDGTAAVTVGAEIAGESALNSSNPRLGLKYSFSLKHNDGSSRVTDLELSLDGVPIANPGVTIYENCPGCLAGEAGAVDFDYVTNAGANGDVSILTNGDARTILDTDGFHGNDGGGSDGEALAIAVMDPVLLDLGEGDYTLTLTGTIKGNSGAAQHDFAVSRQVTIISLSGCNQAE